MAKPDEIEMVKVGDQFTLNNSDSVIEVVDREYRNTITYKIIKVGDQDIADDAANTYRMTEDEFARSVSARADAPKGGEHADRGRQAVSPERLGEHDRGG